MNSESESVNLLKQIVGILQNNQQTQEKVENLLIEIKNENKENHKEQMELLKEIKEGQEFSLEESKIFKSVVFELQSKKMFGAISTDARSLKWMSSLGIASVGFSLIFALPTIAPIIFFYIFPDTILPILDTQFLIKLKGGYILFCIIGTILALIWNNLRLKKRCKDSLGTHFAEMRVLEEIYFN